MKFTCIIDTSSYINLSKVDSFRGSLLDLLSNEVKFCFSSEVNKEIIRHQNDNMPTIDRRKSQIHYLKKTKPSVYEPRLFDQKSNKNKGEKYNYIVSIDLFLNENKRNLIFLIDDEAALRGCLNEVKKALPIMRIWNSYDVVLFLYLIGNKRDFTFDYANNALRDLNKEMAPDDTKVDPQKTQKRIKKLADYNKYLKRIKKFQGN